MEGRRGEKGTTGEERKIREESTEEERYDEREGQGEKAQEGRRWVKGESEKGGELAWPAFGKRVRLWMVQGLKPWATNAGGKRSIPGQGTRILPAAQHSQMNK